MALFLYRDRLVELGDVIEPAQQGSFPLNDQQYAQLNVDDLMQLLTEGLSDNPSLAEEKPRFILAICHMLYDKGNINAVRVKDEAAGPVLSCARVPFQSLMILDELRMRGGLTQEAVDDAVWAPLGWRVGCWSTSNTGNDKCRFSFDFIKSKKALGSGQI